MTDGEYNTVGGSMSGSYVTKSAKAARDTCKEMKAEGIIVEANESWLKLFKLKAFEDIDGTTLMDSFDPDSHAALKGALVATVAGTDGRDVRESVVVSPPPLELAVHGDRYPGPLP